MFGIFGGGIPSAQSLLNPFNIAKVPMPSSLFSPYSYLPPVTNNVVQPTPSQPNPSYYADYRNYNFGNPLANLKTPTGINPGFVGVNKVTTPITSQTQNQFNWGYTAPPAVAKTIVPVKPIKFK